jgi:CzcA family heavy metal efflux pump
VSTDGPSGLYGWSKRYEAVLWLLTAGGCAYGLYAALHLASGIYPEVDFARIVVVAHAGDAAADVILTTMTRPLEEAVATVPGVRRIRSSSTRGTSELSIAFAPGTDMARALSMVEGRVNEAKGELPDGADLVTERLTPTAFPVLTFNLTGGSGVDLHDLAVNLVRPALTGVDGVGRVEVVGGDVREVEVLVDPDAAAGLGLDAASVAELLRRDVGRSTAGHLVDHHQTVTVEATSEPADAAGLGAVPIAVVGGTAVPLSAIATVRAGAADRTAEVSGPRGPTVQIAVSRMEGASTPAVASAAREAGAALAPSLPRGVRLDPIYDQSRLVQDSIRSVRDAILVGIVLCIGVLGVFLRDARAGAVAGAAVPLTLVLTFGAMQLLGQTLDLMSLGGMAVAIGLVVDDAIVIVEAIARHRETGASADEAASRGVSELLAPVIGTTATTIVVFLPLALLSGVVGRFFQALAITLAAAVAISLVVAVTIVPLAAGRWLRPGPNRSGGALSRGYGRLLRASLAHRWVGGVLAVGVAAVGALAATQVETGFLPTTDEGGFVLDYFLPAGSSLPDTAASALKIEAALRTIPEVDTWSRRTGAELGPAAATATNSGDIMVRLVPQSRRDRSAEEVIADARERVAAAVPGVRTEYVQLLQDVLDDLAGAPHPIEVKLYGPDYAVLAGLAADVTARIDGTDGVADLYGGVEGRSPLLRFAIDPVAARRLGLHPDDVTALLDANVRGSVPCTLPYLDRRIDVRVRADDAVRFDPDRLAAIPVVGEGLLTTLGAVAHPEPTWGPTSLDREDLRPVVVVSADEEGRDLGSIIADIRERLDGFTLPKGYTMALGGAYEQQQAAFAELERVMALAVLAVLVVLAAQFRAIRLPLVVLATAPLAVVGALVTLWVTGTPVNVSSLMGILLLVGLVVKNGILLLEAAEVLREGGMDPTDALVAAGELRIRPILMTTLCTVFGLLPLALGLGAGADLQKPLAIAVIGGLSVSTCVSLFLLPSLALRRSR